MLIFKSKQDLIVGELLIHWLSLNEFNFNIYLSVNVVKLS